jgi:ABC-type spermidine/putrescine transport system permease subunit I
MKYINILREYLGNQKRWNELGHSFMSFIMGCLHPVLAILWLGFAIIDELFGDGHWNYFKETKDQQLDFWFDLQSKIIPTFLGYFYINHILPTNSIIYSTVILFLIFFLGYKASWFYSKGDKK